MHYLCLKSTSPSSSWCCSSCSPPGSGVGCSGFCAEFRDVTFVSPIDNFNYRCSEFLRQWQKKTKPTNLCLCYKQAKQQATSIIHWHCPRRQVRHNNSRDISYHECFKDWIQREIRRRGKWIQVCRLNGADTMALFGVFTGHALLIWSDQIYARVIAIMLIL